MVYVYMDSGTSNTRAYLLRDGALLAEAKAPVGTKDSAIAGDNAVLVSGMKKLYDGLLEAQGLTDDDVGEIWMSGMVTNGFGVHEAPHMSLPVDARALAEQACVYKEENFFGRELHLVRGAKTTAPDAAIDFSNLPGVGNVRGEEIEIIGLMGSGGAPQTGAFAVVAPGSHTHVCYVRNGKFCDILSCFTGELNFAIGKDTILSGELFHGDVAMEEENVLRGYGYLKEYGMVRALYILHASKVFEVCPDAVRSQMLAGVISGGVAELVGKKQKGEWSDLERVYILGDKPYIASYKILMERELGVPAELKKNAGGRSFALAGFLELIRKR